MRCGTSEDDVIDVGAIADGLVRDPAGYWKAPSAEAVSYPAEDSDVCFQVEETSFWFAHRNRAITAVADRFPPRGAIVDIGGGNGFVAKALADRGHDVVLVEPSPDGAAHAVSRGLRHVVCGTLAAARFHPATFGAAGLFDVVEHIEDDVAFLRSLRPLLAGDAPVYVTVPAYRSLWSVDDDAAGHFRRYSRGTLSAAFAAAGFDVVFSTYFFAPLPLPILLLRSLPSRLGMRRRADATEIAREHGGGFGARLLRPLLDAELRRIARGRSIPFGASLLAVAV